MPTPKQIVRACYDAVAEKWAKERGAEMRDPIERTWLDRFLATLESGAHVLDLGCGNGAPIMSELIARGLRVTGVDFSTEQLRLARERCAEALFIEADLTEVKLAPESFAGVIAFDSIWNVPREEHAAVFARMHDWLVPGGHALITLGAPEDGEHSDSTFLGVPTFYGGWPLRVTIELLHAAQLTIVDHELSRRGLIIFLRRDRLAS
jgi:cyclopropane fatty-acyl-phospholipid synthase-like methyltransferase